MAQKDNYIAVIREKVSFFKSDTRSFIYLRTRPEFKFPNSKLGGGNFTIAINGMVLLGVFSKYYRAITKPEKFQNEDNPTLVQSETNENHAFSAFNQWLGSQNLNLGIDPKGEQSKLVWGEIRDWLIHRYDTSHLIATYGYPESVSTTDEVDLILAKGIDEGRTPFSIDESGKITFYVDLFYAFIDRIEVVIEALISNSELKPATIKILDKLILGL